ncbi:lipid-binding SYLF domain-containing protein [Cellulophaga sp. E16_2]|uniref:lipid-binding SYLF domain-containing protein n=1 Tax=unclassified Cellulophaga TaxID=2634405 RepID=UPI0013FDA504|nr:MULTISPECIES: lipid-binding SYLF domain-containing protein [unclassified Cellulophaga]MBO0590190.1 lipid-binding SYLF domain-containing protein [Cellulophaga sp. E16_2]
MKTLKTILLGAILFTSFSGFSQTDKEAKIMKDAEKVKIKMVKTDKGLKTFMDNSTAYVIFPNVGEGALIIGGASGNGVVYENGKPIGFADLKKLDIGLQAGGQALSEIIFFETEEALAKFKDDELTFSAEASAVILESGASKNANYSDGVVVFAMPKAGVMADLSVGGQRLSYESFDDRSEK